MRKTSFELRQSCLSCSSDIGLCFVSPTKRFILIRRKSRSTWCYEHILSFTSSRSSIYVTETVDLVKVNHVILCDVAFLDADVVITIWEGKRCRRSWLPSIVDGDFPPSTAIHPFRILPSPYIHFSGVQYFRPYLGRCLWNRCAVVVTTILFYAFLFP